MIGGYLRTLTIMASVGAGVLAGVFFAFSAFVMKALGRLPAAEGIAAMNAINKAAPTPLLMTTSLVAGCWSADLGKRDPVLGCAETPQ